MCIFFHVPVQPYLGHLQWSTLPWDTYFLRLFLSLLLSTSPNRTFPLMSKSFLSVGPGVMRAGRKEQRTQKLEKKMSTPAAHSERTCPFHHTLDPLDIFILKIVANVVNDINIITLFPQLNLVFADLWSATQTQLQSEFSSRYAHVFILFHTVSERLSLPAWVF